MSEQDNEKVIDKIKKLLAIANDSAATEGERDNALRMAHKLLVKHNLDMKDLHKHGINEPRLKADSETFQMKWCIVIASSMAKLFMCKMFLAGKINATKGRYSFVGLESNATTAVLMTEYVIASILKEARKRYKHNLSPESRAFGHGAANKIESRVNEMVDNVQQEIGTGIVVRSMYQNEFDLNMEFVKKELGVNLVPVKSKKTKIDNWGAYIEGTNHGGKINLNMQLSEEEKEKQLQLESK